MPARGSQPSVARPPRLARGACAAWLASACLAAAVQSGQSRTGSGQEGGQAKAGAAEPAAAAKAKRPPRVLPGEDAELKTKDGWTLSARYLQAQGDRPTFILLHETAGRKENWYFLARAMARQGFGIMAVDLRGHGASRTPPPGAEGSWNKFRIPKDPRQPNEWNNMQADVEAAVAFLAGKGVPETSMAMGGADVGSSIALKYAATHRAVPMLFMLSPGMSYREVLTVNALRVWGKRPILMVVGNDDERCIKESAIMFQFAKNAAGEGLARLINADREHGTRLLVVNKGLVARIIEWMENPEPEPEPSEEPAEGLSPGLDGDAPPPLPPPEQGGLEPSVTP